MDARRNGERERERVGGGGAVLVSGCKKCVQDTSGGMRISRGKGGKRRGRKEEGVATKKATSCARARYVSATL